MKVVISDLPAADLDPGTDCHIIEADGSGKHCIGCFGCWVRTPGECVIHDGLEKTGAWMGAADELILISRCRFGSVSPAVKKVQDRAISYIHPYFAVRNGEMHHQRRYENHLQISAYLYGRVTETEKKTMQGILEEEAVNYDGTLRKVLFCETPEELLKEICL